MDFDSEDETPLGQLVPQEESWMESDDEIPLSQLVARDGDSGDAFADDTPLSELVGETKKKKRHSKSARSGKPAKVAKTSKKKAVSNTTVFPVSNYKVRERNDPLEPEQKNIKWWNQPPLPDGQKWTTLEHNGILFPPLYKPHGVPLLYDGQTVQLEPAAEEVATFYAAMLDHDLLKNPRFNENFFRDFKALLPSGAPIKTLSKCDFSRINAHIVADKERIKEERKTPEYKAQKKAETAEINAVYGTAIVNGFKQRVGNFRVEIPGLFRGRGDHPKTGSVKRRVVPEDITINIGRGVPLPRCPDGHQWGGVVHNNRVTWLAFWNENITGSFKYVFLHHSSQFKGQSDFDKYEKARKLTRYIDKIRKNYMGELDSSDKLTQQTATALWIIDRLALRVGNEKDTEEEADTVGCCSLRVEHLEFEEPQTIVFDFLGKDSMRYFNAVQVHPKVFRNLKSFASNKTSEKQIFDLLNTSSLNQYLKSLMDGLTAKVFRTYNASFTLEKELRECPPEKDIKPTSATHEKIAFYNAANKEVAILCNHQRSVPKNFDEQIDKIKTKISDMKKKMKHLKFHLLVLKGKKSYDGADPPEKMSSRPEVVESQMTKLKKRIAVTESQMKLKENNKSVALGTSKINYMDPRITVAWCKEKQVPIQQIFNKSLLEKFPWAMECPKAWRF